MRKEITIHVMQNLRLLMTKAWNRRTPNWVAVSRLTGHGSGMSCQFCRDLGVDPDAYEFKRV